MGPVCRGGPELLVLLLRLGAEKSASASDANSSFSPARRSIAVAARMIVNLLIAEVFNQVHGIARHRNDEMPPIFMGLADHMPVLLQHLLRQGNKKVAIGNFIKKTLRIVLEITKLISYLGVFFRKLKINSYRVLELTCKAS